MSTRSHSPCTRSPTWPGRAPFMRDVLGLRAEPQRRDQPLGRVRSARRRLPCHHQRHPAGAERQCRRDHRVRGRRPPRPRRRSRGQGRRPFRRRYRKPGLPMAICLDSERQFDHPAQAEERGRARMTKVAEAIAALEAKAEARISDGLSPLRDRHRRPGDRSADGEHPEGRQGARPRSRARRRLWESDVYEARLLTAYIDDPALVTPDQMDRWARDFDNWAICDTLCFALVRPDRARLRHGRPLGGRRGRIRQAHRLRFARQPRPARQEKRRTGLPLRLRPHRDGRHRRAQLRQEGRELGAARDRRPEERALRAAAREVAEHGGASDKATDGSARTREGFGKARSRRAHDSRISVYC